MMTVNSSKARAAGLFLRRARGLPGHKLQYTIALDPHAMKPDFNAQVLIFDTDIKIP
jgi:hypothetical protein